jgi:hypothetical protein
MMSKRRDKGRAAQATTTVLTRRETSTQSPGSELPEKLTTADEALAKVQQTFATTDVELTVVLALQAAASLGDPLTITSTIHKSSRAAVHSLGARDGLEALLAVQMVGAHNLAMTFLAQAAATEQTPEGMHLFINLANRLLRTFTAQVETLKTYRSKGEQKVAVEHVHIHRGGQAIVGAVNHNATMDGGGDDKKD